AVAAAHHRRGHDCLDLLRHDTDVGLVAAVVAKAVEAEAVIEVAEEGDVVLKHHVGSPNNTPGSTPGNTSDGCDAGSDDAAGAVESEEPRAAPGRAGDHAGDRRETGISRSLPALARDRDGVALPVILANQHGAGFELARGRAALARKTIQEGQAGAIKAAEG